MKKSYNSCQEALLTFHAVTMQTRKCMSSIKLFWLILMQCQLSLRAHGQVYNTVLFFWNSHCRSVYTCFLCTVFANVPLLSMAGKISALPNSLGHGTPPWNCEYIRKSLYSTCSGDVICPWEVVGVAGKCMTVAVVPLPEITPKAQCHGIY